MDNRSSVSDLVDSLPREVIRWSTVVVHTIETPKKLPRHYVLKLTKTQRLLDFAMNLQVVQPEEWRDKARKTLWTDAMTHATLARR